MKDAADAATMELPLDDEPRVGLKPMFRAALALVREGNDDAAWLCLLHWVAGLEDFS